MDLFIEKRVDEQVYECRLKRINPESRNTEKPDAILLVGTCDTSLHLCMESFVAESAAKDYLHCDIEVHFKDLTPDEQRNAMEKLFRYPHIQPALTYEGKPLE
ncbi:hypothetical protein J4207_00895 [Candidatus Woesearchaeota archaeon]|nr:hypothetical protein [Candidatus Woesearchaeota archaeon]